MKNNKLCSQIQPDNCKYINTMYCAFTRSDKKCTKPRRKNRKSNK